MKQIKPTLITLILLILTRFGIISVISFPSSNQLISLPFRSLEERIAVANFNFDPAVQCSYTPIQFTNLSTGDSLIFQWDFGDPESGDNNTSSEVNPSHTFIGSPGIESQTFSVSLTVTDLDGTEDTITKEINLNQAPSPNITSNQTGTDFGELRYLVVCESSNTEFILNNASTTQSTNTNYELDWGDGSEIFTGTDWTELSHSYPVGIYRIKYSVTGENGCIATREYGIFVGANPAVGLGNPGNTNVCGGQTLSFPITGTENNPVGTKYIVDYSDNTPQEEYDHPPPSSVTHTFAESSCGINGGGFPNSYSVTITAINPCSASSARVSPIYVSEPPDPEFSAPTAPVCVNTTVNIQNQTELGGEVSTNGECTDYGQFVWEISPETGWELSSGSLGELFNPDVPSSWSNGSININPVFTVPGTYTVTLISGNRCGINEEVKTICVTDLPEAAFETNITEGCGPQTITTTNNSSLDETCGESAPYQWTVRYSSDFCGTSADWSFAEESDQNSEEPVFQFNNPGRYTITMEITTTCGTFSEEQEIQIFDTPKMEISPIANICEPSEITPVANVDICNPGEATYSWTFEGGTPSSSSNPEPGTVFFENPGENLVILEVSSSCGTSLDTVRFNFNLPPEIDAGIDSTICLGESIILSGSSSTPGNYSYQWTSSGSSSISDPSSLNPTVTPTENIVFTLLATDLETGCFMEDEVSITVQPAPIINFSIPNQIICSGSQSEVVSLTSSSGAPVSWTADFGAVTGEISSGNDNIPSQILVNTSNETIDVVFTALINDSEQDYCFAQPITYTISVIPSLNLVDEELQICNGDTFNFLPSNHIEGTLYTWSILSSEQISGAEGQSNPSPNISQTLTNNSDENATVIYEIIPEIEGCTGAPFLLELSVIPSKNISFSLPDQTICSGEETQEVSISSNLPDTEFSWTVTANGLEGLIPSGESNIIPSQILTNPTDEPITAIFEINSTADSQGDCPGNTFTYSITVNPALSLQTALSDYNGFQISCFGAADGSIDVSAIGGNGNYNYEWSGPEGFTDTSPQISDLAAGNYTLTVQDDLGCLLTETYLLKEPSGVSIALLNASPVLCAGDSSGAINMEVSGGNPSIPYVFEWQRDSETLANNEQNLSNIPAGEYFLTVYNGENCPSSFGPIIITEPSSPMLIDYTKQDITCYGDNDGQISLDVQGGVPPYQISWDFGSSQTAFDQLGPGNYTVTVADQAGCIKTETIEIIDAPLFQINPIVQHISCAGQEDGSIELQLEQELAYTIRWDHGSELENIFNLSSGTYGVTIEMADGCQIREEFNIIEPAPLVIEPQVTDALDCLDPQTGQISIGISGGRPPYNISWSNGASTQELTNLTAGLYEVTVQDSSGCTTIQQLEIKRPKNITVNNTRQTVISCESNEVFEEIELFVTGGTPPYTINWSAGEVLNNGLLMRTPLSGLFTAEVMDSRGCMFTTSFEIDNPPTIVDAAISSAAMQEFNTYLVNYEIAFQNLSSGNITEVFWDFGDGSSSNEDSPVHTYSSPGNYTILLRVSDQYGCTSEIELNVEVSDYFLEIPNVFTPNDDGVNDLFFPKFIFIQSLEFWVYNKWGEVIFHTNDLNSDGWDGTIDGEPAQPGNYIYKLNYNTMDNRSKSITDVVMLLK